MQTNTTLNIQCFCATQDDPRGWMRAPFSCDGQTVATNGHVMQITLPVPGTRGILVSDAIYKIVRLICNASYSAAPPVQMPVPIVCKPCQGTGYAKRETCAECSGMCFVDARNEYNSYSVQCKTCDGDGETYSICDAVNGPPCPCCLGSGRDYHPLKSVTVLGIRIAARYYALIAGCPDLQLAIADTSFDPTRHLAPKEGQPAAENNNSVLLFKTGADASAIMPMRAP